MDDEISSLSRDIADVDGTLVAPGLEAAKVESATAAAGWAEIPASIGMLIGMALPECKEAFSDENCQEWGRHMARVAEKHGWSGTDGLPPEVSVALCSVGMAFPVVVAVKTRRLAAKQAQAGGQGNGQALATG